MELLKKTAKINLLIFCLVALQGALFAQDRKTEEPKKDQTETKKQKRNDDLDQWTEEFFNGKSKYKGKHLFSDLKVTGAGGGPLFFYGYGDSLKDVGGAGGRGYAILNDSWRFGGIGFGFSNDFYNDDENTGGGAGGLYNSFMLRMDPVIVGIGGAFGAAGYGTVDKTKTGDARSDGDAYFWAMPMLETEIRLFEWASMSIYGGYAFFIGKKTAPEIDHLQVGIMFTFGRF